MHDVGSAEDKRDGQRVSVRVTDELYDALKAQADLERRSLSNLVTIILEDGLRARVGELAPPAKPKRPRTPRR
jgi:hypothetical protein